MNTTFEPLEHETHADDLAVLEHLASGLSMRRVVTAVEVGSWVGSSARVLAGNVHRLYCVDTWQGNPHDRLGEVAQRVGADEVFQTFCRNMGDKLFRNVFPCRGTSAMWASIWPSEVDLVFIDANHDYESVKADILAWKPHVRRGGILAGHDYWSFPSVKLAVDELLDVQTEGDVWWTQLGE